MDHDHVLEQARQSLTTTGQRIADLVGSAPDLSAMALGLEWNLQQVMAHLVTGTNYVAEWVKGNAPALSTLDPAVSGPAPRPDDRRLPRG